MFAHEVRDAYEMTAQQADLLEGAEVIASKSPARPSARAARARFMGGQRAAHPEKTASYESMVKLARTAR